MIGTNVTAPSKRWCRGTRRLLVVGVVGVAVGLAVSACSGEPPPPVGELSSVTSPVSSTDDAGEAAADPVAPVPGPGELPSPHQVDTLAGDYPAYDSIDSAVAAADVVVEAVVVSSRDSVLLPDDLTGVDDPYLNPQYGADEPPDDLGSAAVATITSSVRVVQSLKGALTPGTVISVSQVGGGQYAEEGSTLLPDSASDSVVLFLEAGADGLYYPLNPYVGVWARNGENIFPVNGTNSYSLTTFAALESAVLGHNPMTTDSG